MPQAAPFGGWRSPITAASIAAGEVALGRADIVGDDVYWLEGKPLEGGRVVLVRRRRRRHAPGADARSRCHVRTRVHEYGGGAYLRRRLDRLLLELRRPAPVPPGRRRASRGRSRRSRPCRPACATPTRSSPRTADLLICVRERHASDGPDATNELVVLPADGSADARSSPPGTTSTPSPRISPDGRRLAWLSGTTRACPGTAPSCGSPTSTPTARSSNARRVAGGAEESIFQPEWSPTASCTSSPTAAAGGTCTACTARRSSRWRRWRPSSARRSGSSAWPPTPSWPTAGSPASSAQDGIDRLVLHRRRRRRAADRRPAVHRRIAAPVALAAATRWSFVAALADRAAAVVRLDVDQRRSARCCGRSLRARRSTPATSRGRASIAFPTEGGARPPTRFYYPPTNADFAGPAGERPPLIVDEPRRADGA